MIKFTLWIQRLALLLLMSLTALTFTARIIGSVLHGDVIAFASDRDSASGELYALDFTSGIILRLTHNGVQDNYPVWSPRAAQIVYNCRLETSWEICLLDVITGRSQPLTYDDADDYWATWSPDGTHILFYSDRDGNNEIYRMNPMGDEVRRLTYSPFNDVVPSYSPDGTQIAFTSDSEIYIMDVLPDGTVDYANRQRVTINTGYDSQAAWSPDGRQLLYASERNTPSILNLFIVALEDNTAYEGSGVRWLEYSRADSYSPVWSPAGTRIMFGMRLLNNDPLLYVLDIFPDGTVIPGSERLLRTWGRAWSPAWMP